MALWVEMPYYMKYKLAWMRRAVAATAAANCRAACPITRGLSTIKADKNAAVSIIGVLALFLIIGFAALAIELGEGYEIKIANQGTADAAALAAANAYAISPTQATLTSTADDVALANGIASSNVTVNLLTNYSSTVSNAVQVVIAAQVPVYFAPILIPSLNSYTVNVSAIASMAPSSPPCILALSKSGTGLTLSGNGSISASSCTARSNASVSVSGSSSISSQYLYASNSVATSGTGSITATSTFYGTSASGSRISGTLTKQSNSMLDPESKNVALSNAFSQLGNYTSPTVPSVPTGADLSLQASATTMTFQGYTGTLVGNTWSFPAGTYNIKNLSTSVFKLSIASGSTVTVGGTVNIGTGGGIAIGDGTVSMLGSVTTGNFGTFTLGAGTHYLGSLSTTGPAVTIGAGDLTVNGAISVNGGSITIGAGNYVIGNDGSGSAISVAGLSSALTFGNGNFSANGNISTTSGGSLTFGAATNHLVNGNIDLKGTATFGAGTYTIDGFLSNNANGTATGSNVSFVMGGTFNVTGGASVNLAAPNSSSSYGIPDILFATKTTTPTSFGGGSRDVFAGVIYAPNSDLSMNGGSSASGNGACLSVIAQSISMSGGGAIATTCPSLSSAMSTGMVGILQ